MSARSLSLKTFAWTWLALVVLAALSLWLSTLALGAWEMPLALAIAGVKAVLVLLVFMELWTASFLPRFVIVVILAALALLMSLMILDVLTRRDEGVRPPVSGVAPAHHPRDERPPRR